MPRPPRSRPLPTVARIAAVAAVAVLLGACDQSLASPSPSMSADAGSTPAVASPSAVGSTEPSGPDASAPTTPPSTTIGQTDTEWGRIWDELPPGFPAYPGSTPTETGEGPVSGQLSVPANVATVSTFLQAALEGAGYSTEAMSGPFEDGSMTIESTNPDFGACRVRTTIAPAGDTTLVTVLYGADCPIG